MAEPQLVRTFIAIALSDEIHRNLAAFQNSLKKHNADISWVKPDNIHLTLQFLGEIHSNLVEKIGRCLEEIIPTQSAFTFEVAGTGVFPNPKRARVLWIGVTQGKKMVIQLQSEIAKSLEKLNILTEDRAFHPHLTLGRVRSPKNLDTVIAELLNQTKLSFGMVPVIHVTLFSSRLSPSGAIYTPLKQIAIKPV